MKVGLGMKKFFKWAAIVVGSIILIVLIFGLYTYWKYVGFGNDYPSGGALPKLESLYDVTSYDINIAIDIPGKSIKGHTTLGLRPLGTRLDTLETDLVPELKVDSVIYLNKHVPFSRMESKLFIYLPVTNDSLLYVTVFYGGEPPEAVNAPWRGGFVWKQDANDAPWIGLACQGEGAKIWFPCKDHPSDEADSVAINITVPDTLIVASNGLLRGKTLHIQNHTVTYHWFTEYNINNYDINFGVGKYTRLRKFYHSVSGDSMPVDYYVLKQNETKAEQLVDQAIDMLGGYSSFFGEYPWFREKFGLLDSPYLGMEHQTLNAYGNHYRMTHLGKLTFDELMLHEMGHEWWGNKITAKDWAHFWLHEGICTYGEALYLESRGGDSAYFTYMKGIQKRIRNNTPIVQKEPANTEDSYTSDIYPKGAMVMHSLRYILGDSVFLKTLKQFATDPAYTYPNFVVTRDLTDLMNKNSGMDLSGFFHMYLYTTDLPKVVIQELDEGRYEIQISNIDFALPMDVDINGKTSRMMLGNKAVMVQADQVPQIDPQNWYLKDVKIKD